MTDLLKSLVTLPTPLPQEIARTKANCFNAVQLFWQDQKTPGFTGPEEFVSYLNYHFIQAPQTNQKLLGDVTVVWSRSSNLLPLGDIEISKFQKNDSNYPYGLVIEHAFVQMNGASIFQKRDSTANGSYEILSFENAIKPYVVLQGFELTLHRRKIVT